MTSVDDAGDVEIEIELIGDVEQPLHFVDAVSPTPSMGGHGRLPLAALGLLMAVGVGAALLAAGGNDAANESTISPSPDTTPTLEPDFEVEPSPGQNPEDFIGVAPDGLPPTGETFPFRPWDGAEVLVAAFSGTQDVFIVDLATGEQKERQAPEPLVDVAPVSLEGVVVVVGTTNAWATDVDTDFEVWRRLGAADDLRPSIFDDRVWLRTSFERNSISDPAVRWDEVDASGPGVGSGTVHRWFQRTLPILLAPPELIYGIANDVNEITDDPRKLRRLLAAYSAPIAVGRNDVIDSECEGLPPCDRVWFDANTAEEKGLIYNDLADNIEGLYGSLLSADGRFLVVEDDEGATKISSIATGLELSNGCRTDVLVAWTAGSELAACAAGDGIVVYDTEVGESIGLGLRTNGEPGLHLTFVPLR